MSQLQCAPLQEFLQQYPPGVVAPLLHTAVDDALVAEITEATTCAASIERLRILRQLAQAIAASGQ